MYYSIGFFILVGCTLESFSGSEPPYIKIFYYSDINPSDSVIVDLTNSTQVAETPFSFEKDTFFYVHGWLDQVEALPSTGQLLKHHLLLNQDVNVFLVDWTSVAKNAWYIGVAQKVEDVGKQLGSLIWNLVENNGLNLDRTTLMGMCLGAHVAGIAGHVLDGMAGQAVGIDPAGPWFYLGKTSNRLTKSSAKFVEVIHTCGGRLGFSEPSGHADYYPNGGKVQPMCAVDPVGKCAQYMGMLFYLESLQRGNFTALRCESFEKFQSGACNGADESWMGAYQMDKRAAGTYFLETNKFPPFAKKLTEVFCFK